MRSSQPPDSAASSVRTKPSEQAPQGFAPGRIAVALLLVCAGSNALLIVILSRFSDPLAIQPVPLRALMAGMVVAAQAAIAACLLVIGPGRWPVRLLGFAVMIVLLRSTVRFALAWLTSFRQDPGQYDALL